MRAGNQPPALSGNGVRSVEETRLQTSPTGNVARTVVEPASDGFAIDIDGRLPTETDGLRRRSSPRGLVDIYKVDCDAA